MAPGRDGVRRGECCTRCCMQHPQHVACNTRSARGGARWPRESRLSRRESRGRPRSARAVASQIGDLQRRRWGGPEASSRDLPRESARGRPRRRSEPIWHHRCPYQSSMDTVHSDDMLDPVPTLVELARNPGRVADMPLPAVPPLLAQVAALQAALVARLARAPIEAAELVRVQAVESERLLAPPDAAALLGVTVSWLYRHADRLPFSRRLSRKALRFSELGLRRWLATRKP